jgi:hypothetical protein
MTGSLVNNIYSKSESPAPEIGMGVTQLCFSDRHPYTIIDVISSHEILVQSDNAVRVDNNGMSDSQDWEFSPNPRGIKHILTLRKNGAWKCKGDSLKSSYNWMIGKRSKYHDFSF